jgi:hypothetical protein
MERLTWRERRLLRNLRANVEERMTMMSAQREMNEHYNRMMQKLLDPRTTIRFSRKPIRHGLGQESTDA